jgi:hypothetical protein
VNASQPMVERHLVDTEHPQSSTQACNPALKCAI